MLVNQEHLAVLKQGIEVWNQWRNKHTAIRPNLSGADLREAKLSKVNLSGADLSGANLSHADLNGADLSGAIVGKVTINIFNVIRADLSGIQRSGAVLGGANLSHAYLRAANLKGTFLRGVNLGRADLSHADLRYADLSDANLSETYLIEADLTRADFTRADLNGADLHEAKMGWTYLGDVDLQHMKGLETITHRGPSTIGIDTIYRSQGNIPEAFLQGAGVDDTFIASVRSLVNTTIEYYSCFISYSSKDDDFAKRLYADLQSNNVEAV